MKSPKSPFSRAVQGLRYRSVFHFDELPRYKVDRLTRSLANFAKIVESFDGKGASFVSVNQQFNTTISMGRLTLNILLSFAQFEREVTGERIRDKVAASKKKACGWVRLFLSAMITAIDSCILMRLKQSKSARSLDD